MIMIQSSAIFLLTIMAVFSTPGSFHTPVKKSDMPADHTAPALADNPLLRPWAGRYGGVPPFDKVEVSHFKPALEAAMNERLTVSDSLASLAARADCEFTFVALARAGQPRVRVQRI